MKTNPKKMSPIITLFLLLFTVYRLPITQIHAKSALGLTAIPPRLEIKNAKPGSVITKEIKVRNESRSQRLITLSIKDIFVKDDSGTPLVLENITSSENRWAASAWLQASQTSLRLNPGETKGLLLTAIIPDDALPGGHYAAIFYTGQDLASLNETGSSVQANVVTIVYLTESSKNLLE
jgi:hypothetical protein